MKKKIRILALLTLIVAFRLSAITPEDLAGVYIGKRTDTYLTFSKRYDEVFVFEPDGRVTDYLYLDGFPEPLFFSGYMEIREDGSFPNGEYGEGFLILHGRHLSLSVDYFFPPSPFYPDGISMTIVFRGHRTEKALDLPPATQ
jgi:hypothetical protein